MKEKLHSFGVSAFGRAAVVVSIVGTALMIPSLAGATTYDPTSDATSFANTATGSAAPIVFIVAGALVALAIVFWVVRFVFGLLGARTRR